MKKVEEVKGTEKAVDVPQVDVKNLSQDQALNILVQAVKLAQKRGAFELEETEVILNAIRVFIPKN